MRRGAKAQASIHHMHETKAGDGLARGDLSSFLAGYLRCRVQTGSTVEPLGGGFLVRYARPMRRSLELYIEASAIGRAEGFAPGADAWVTVVGALPEPPGPPLLAALAPIEHEFVMTAPLPLRARATAAVERGTAADIAALNARGEFPPIEAELATSREAALFVARYTGEIGAIGRCARGEDGDVVVDRMVTLARFRRRGLASAILGAMSADAGATGARRMLLISSQMGRPVYERAGFVAQAPVTVFAQSAPSG
jgi:GNAT superfamily N-acetyltransferase